MSNYKGEINIGGHIDGSTTDPIDVPCKAGDVERLQVMYAAAPEMLGALKNIRAQLAFEAKDPSRSDTTQAINQADAAIAKATGS